MPKSLNIPGVQLNPCLRNGRNMTRLNLPKPGHHHKLNDRARRRLVKEATKTPMTTLKEIKASAAELGEMLHNVTTFSQAVHQSELCRRVDKKKPLLKEAH